MRKPRSRALAVISLLAPSVGLAACSAEPRANVDATDRSAVAAEPAGEHAAPERGGEHVASERRGEHAGSGDREHDRGHRGSEGVGEESGERIAPADTWDRTRNGARLVLSFESATNTFVGTVENNTSEVLCAVRVEVHLSSGAELGPTARTDLRPGESTAVRLPTGGEAFASWTAHPEISDCR